MRHIPSGITVHIGKSRVDFTEHGITILDDAPGKGNVVTFSYDEGMQIAQTMLSLEKTYKRAQRKTKRQ